MALTVLVLLMAVKNAKAYGPVGSWFWVYTLIVPEFDEKIAPKIKIKITGKINPKNNPNLFLRYPRLNNLKSERILFPVEML